MKTYKSINRSCHSPAPELGFGVGLTLEWAVLEEPARPVTTAPHYQKDPSPRKYAPSAVSRSRLMLRHPEPHALSHLEVTPEPLEVSAG